MAHDLEQLHAGIEGFRLWIQAYGKQFEKDRDARRQWYDEMLEDKDACVLAASCAADVALFTQAVDVSRYILRQFDGIFGSGPSDDVQKLLTVKLAVNIVTLYAQEFCDQKLDIDEEQLMGITMQLRKLADDLEKGAKQ